MIDNILVVLLSILTGVFVGVLFTAFRLPLPAPPTFAGVCGIFGVSKSDFKNLAAAIKGEVHHRRSGRSGKDKSITTTDAYAVLGVSANTTNAEIKKAYRRLLSQHHPDKLVSKGLPEEMMKIATQRTHEIRQAYEKIKQERNF